MVWVQRNEREERNERDKREYPRSETEYMVAAAFKLRQRTVVAASFNLRKYTQAKAQSKGKARLRSLFRAKRGISLLAMTREWNGLGSTK